MLTSVDIEALNALARDLAHSSFGGAGSVGRDIDGIVRLTIMKHDRGTGGLYRERDMAALTFEAASKEVTLAMQAATGS